ncbi:MAG: AraC family transcriptional regulator [Anaerocolumna sp.]|jgi:AraC-like DNA-binding protein|nr:AraC family transcriptional regulator [Anaerocolumna sp.]
MMDALLRQMFVLILRQIGEGSIVRYEEEGTYTEFVKARLKLLTQCEKQWNISSMCSLVHLEKSPFYSYYEKYFSISPKADLLKARMEKATILLSNEALQVQQVADLCGFVNVSHFTRQFKKLHGCTPGEYSKKIY